MFSKVCGLFFLASFLGLMLGLTNGVHGQELVVDLAHGGSSYPQNFIVFNEVLYFLANDEVHDPELWSYTPAQGASLVADIREQFGARPSPFVVFKDRLYFGADGSPETGVELWEYDGVNPPVLTAEINPGDSSSSPRNFFVHGDALYFSARRGGSNFELWRYTGEGEPESISGLMEGQSLHNPADFTVYDGHLYFSADDGNDRVMWRYDEVHPPEKAYSNDSRTITDVAHLFAFDGKLLFSARLNYGAHVLWSYDATDNQLTRVTGAPPSPTAFTMYKEKLYLMGYSGGRTHALWQYDGVTPPELVAELSEAAGDGPFDTVVLNDVLYLLPGNKLWQYKEGEPPVQIEAVSALDPQHLTSYNQVLYFSGYTKEHGHELYAYDTVNPPYLAADINTWYPSNPRDLTLFQEALYFSNEDDPFQVYRFAGEEVTTLALNPGSRTILYPLGFQIWNNALYFFAQRPNQGRVAPELLFKYESGPEATLIDSIYFATNRPRTSRYPNQLIPYKEKLYFGGHDGQSGYELWRYDGINRPGMVADVYPGDTGSQPARFAVYDETLYFTVEDDGVHGRALWSYTEENGAAFVSELDPEAETWFSDKMIVHQGALFISGEGALWRYDGQQEPVRINADDPDRGSFFPPFSPSHLISVDDKLYFIGNERTMNGTLVGNLWVYDGASPPEKVDLPGPVGRLDELVLSGEWLCFSEEDDGIGHDLGCYNVVDASTFYVNINPYQSAQPEGFVTLHDDLYFSADDGQNGRELWRLDLNRTTGTARERIPGTHTPEISAWYPNPSRTTTQLTITLDQPDHVRAELYDVLGRRVQVVNVGPLTPGTRHLFKVNLGALSPGLYLCRISGQTFRTVRTVVRAG